MWAVWWEQPKTSSIMNTYSGRKKEIHTYKRMGRKLGQLMAAEGGCRSLVSRLVGRLQFGEEHAVSDEEDHGVQPQAVLNATRISQQYA